MLTPDEGAEPPAHRCLESCSPLTNAIEPVDLLRFGFALDGVLTRKSRLDHSLHQSVRCVAHQNRVRLGERLQACRKIHRVAQNCNPSIGTTSTLPTTAMPSIETDSHLRTEPMLSFKFRCGSF